MRNRETGTTEVSGPATRCRAGVRLGFRARFGQVNDSIGNAESEAGPLRPSKRIAFVLAKLCPNSVREPLTTCSITEQNACLESVRLPPRDGQHQVGRRSDEADCSVRDRRQEFCAFSERGIWVERSWANAAHERTGCERVAHTNGGLRRKRSVRIGCAFVCQVQRSCIHGILGNLLLRR